MASKTGALENAHGGPTYEKRRTVSRKRKRAGRCRNEGEESRNNPKKEGQLKETKIQRLERQTAEEKGKNGKTFEKKRHSKCWRKTQKKDMTKQERGRKRYILRGSHRKRSTSNIIGGEGKFGFIKNGKLVGRGVAGMLQQNGLSLNEREGQRYSDTHRD